MTQTLVHGAGRMAHRVLALIADSEGLELAGIVSRHQPDENFGVDWSDSLELLNTPVDLLIDFTLPGGTGVAAQWCAANKVALLSGTTGLTDEDIGALKKAAQDVPVLWAPNLSHGVALITALVRQAASALGVRANISISDIHHQHKLDAPSGTAMALASAVMEGRSERLQELLSPERIAGMSGAEEGELAFSSVREGEVARWKEEKKQKFLSLARSEPPTNGSRDEPR
ncbi:MAG: dihydrodipicolinate reductase C-terminal domain-containing protein [Lysobacterales bacterium]